MSEADKSFRLFHLLPGKEAELHEIAMHNAHYSRYRLDVVGNKGNFDDTKAIKSVCLDSKYR